MRVDPNFHLELKYCFDNGIPHSVYLEKWSPEDRAKNAAYAMEFSLRCDMCGTADWEWEDDKFAYTPEDKFCRGCYLKSVYGDQESDNLPGTNVSLVPTTKMLSAQKIVKARKRAEKKRAAKKQEAEGGRPDASGERSPDSGHVQLQPADLSVRN